MNLFGSNKRKDCEELYLDIMRLNIQYQKSSIGECKITHMDSHLKWWALSWHE